MRLGLPAVLRRRLASRLMRRDPESGQVAPATEPQASVPPQPAGDSARPFRKILVANRGEIAVRVIRACRDLDIATVAVFSTADRDALHVQFADEAICIGPPAPAASYLHQRNLLSAANITGAEAVHPGYGFLAENADFADAVGRCGLTWIGPSPRAIRTLGDKSRAREAAIAADVPVLEGGPLPESAAEAAAFADGLGYTLMLKAALGGGGRGMRAVGDRAGLEAALESAASEARAAFGSGELIVERLVERPRHIEVQVFGDSFGRTVQLGERDCSIQRRHQKLLEEAPAPSIGAELRQALAAAALRLAKRVGYSNAGTVEFLVDGDRFYFLEMNTRIQVEHPVTESVTGVDLVKLQIVAAAGEPLGLPDGTPTNGHAIECRINAEDPETFAPSPGTLRCYRPPAGPGIRVDSHGFEGGSMPPHYDSLLAKVIAHGANRAEAISRMARALAEFEVDGIRTTLPLMRRIVDSRAFADAELDTGFLARLDAA